VPAKEIMLGIGRRGAIAAKAAERAAEEFW
jgi:hypothetical protein